MRGNPVRGLAVLFFGIINFVFLSGCGGGGGNVMTPPPMGNFTNGNLKGNYAFSYQGSDAAGAPFVAAGQFSANGSGMITVGAIDLNDDDGAGGIFFSPGTNNGTILGTSTYSVAADGETTVTLNVQGSAFPLILQMTLASSTQGLITAFDSNFSGSGTIEMQNTAALLPTNVAFAVSGVDLTTFQEATFAGNLLVNGGAIMAGTSVADFVAPGVFVTPDERDTTISGAITADAANPGRNTVTLVTQAGTFAFAVYVVDNTHVKIAQTDLTSGFLLGGEGFAAPGVGNQQLATGNFAYTVSGEAQDGATFAAGGVFTSKGGAITGGEQDVHSAPGKVFPVETLANEAYSSDATFARIDMKLSESDGTFEYIAYPTSEGSVLLIEIDNATGFSAGTAYVQSTTSAPAGNFALNITGLAITTKHSIPDVQDVVGQIMIASTTITGDLNINNLFNSPKNLLPGLGLSNSTIAAPDATGLGRGNPLNLNSGALGNSGYALSYYTVDGTRVLLLETDGLRVSTGQLLMQTN